MKKRKQTRSGQASFEYILTVVVIGVMILPAAYLFFKYSQSSADQIDKAQLDKLGRDIVSAAEKVYYQGAPSRTNLEARMPRGVRNLSIIGNSGSGAQMLIISATTQDIVTDFPYPSRVNINGSFNASLSDVSVSPGLKQINIEVYEAPAGPGGQTTGFAFINFGGRCPASATYDFNADGVVDGLDATFFLNCYCNCLGLGYPKYRPSKTWARGWFDNTGALGGNQYAVCMNADYNGDCIVDDRDGGGASTPFCIATGFWCGAMPPCPC